ncbi:hypothetical protein BV898_19619 [Hypsibius exemplaris]|uniref:Uncharacterized protein n=1 Tax=Hypsibius exemplaris TaxID=2072580 RepID=A0A9X6NLY4_HYPEX|nr:hypothetical protein BV898_19619 [Hypsibius exemplaris]
MDMQAIVEKATRYSGFAANPSRRGKFSRMKVNDAKPVDRRQYAHWTYTLTAVSADSSRDGSHPRKATASGGRASARGAQ